LKISMTTMTPLFGLEIIILFSLLQLRNQYRIIQDEVRIDSVLIP